MSALMFIISIYIARKSLELIKLKRNEKKIILKLNNVVYSIILV